MGGRSPLGLLACGEALVVGTADRALMVVDAEWRCARVFEYTGSGASDHCGVGVLCGELLVCAGANNSLTVLSA